MEQSFEEGLLQAIKKDDIKAFDALMEKAQCGTFRLGRFPVLSLLYLYKSRKILSVYEQGFLQIASFEVLHEPIEISKKFSAKAGKCLRLYINEVVSPLEMLLILDKTKRLKSVYPLTKTTAAVRGRLKSIYSIKYSLNVKFEGEKIVLDRRPLSYREKKNLFTLCLCLALVVIIIVAVPVTTTSLMPKHVEGDVTKLSHINFESTNDYTLKKDLALPENYSVAMVNCNIIGNGNKLIFGKGATLGEFNGKMSDLTIETEGDPIFTTVSEKATIKNATVNVNAAVTTTSSTAFVTLSNYGLIENVTVNVRGELNARATSDGKKELTFGGIVQNNGYKFNDITQSVYGRGGILNCTVNYSQFRLVGEVSTDASFGGVTGINSGFVEDCTVNGEITSQTFDIAGVCSVNNYSLLGDINNASLSQTSSAIEWHPVVCGIVLTNNFAVANCENRGKISSVSSCSQIGEKTKEYTATAAGIAYISSATSSIPYIKNCTNVGDIECSAVCKSTYAAGVCYLSAGNIESCKNSGKITAKADNKCSMYVGGIASISNWYIYKSINEGAINASGNGLTYAGGISAEASAPILICMSSGDINVKGESVSAGGILGSCEIYKYNYFCTVEYCISQNKINVTATNDSPSYVGGVVGYVQEQLLPDGKKVETYRGGGIINCYFTGEYDSEVSYFGNIAGVCGANIYESNAYVVDGQGYYNFAGNYYLDNSHKAFGTTVNADGTFVSVDDKGANLATIEDIQSSQTYKSILNELGK